MFENYHKHTDGSNIFTPDSSVKYEDYAKRAVELGHKTLSTVEHGYQGMYFEAYKVAKKYGLKFIYGAEAYWVKNRHDKDKTNNHIIILAKNNNGRKALNKVLSEANETGYYYKPRLDLELIMSLPEKDVFITSACVGFWGYENTEDIVLKLYEKFKDNFMLEIQYQPFELQYDINKKILKMHEEYGINIIAGMDSHYIYDHEKIDRDEVLLSKGIKYENEDDFYMDYPDYDTAFHRFKNQNIFSGEQIQLALNNTNLILEFEDYDNVEIFQDNIKLPSLYPNLTQKKKNNKLKKIILTEWNKRKKHIDKTKHKEYELEIKKEFKIIIDTKMTDYFLLDYEIIKESVKKGGIITSSGRGSAVAFYINNLLGFTKIDRIASEVKMFPERFMSVSRILETKSLPDIDFNTGNPEVFVEAQNKIFGEEHSYPMIAYGTFKIKSAFKMYAKAKGLDFEISNRISSQIAKFEKDLSHLDDDEKDTIDIYNYIDSKYHKIFDDSKKYRGIISNKTPHSCGHLIYNKNIREEIGLIKVKTDSTKKETVVCLMDGRSAENFKFLKNDLLKVDVSKTNYLIAKKIGMELPDQNKLQAIANEINAWEIYEKGLTIGVNQLEKQNTKLKGMRYKPKTISELCAFVAGIRPSFQSMYHIFEKRQDFKYEIPTFDKIIRGTGVQASFILYQETIMAVLSFAGFPEDETYSILKAISKKRDYIFKEIKPNFIENLSKKFKDNDNLSHEEATNNANKVWKIIEDSSRYGFNASHSYCMAYDSLLGAVFKKGYALDFYETQLEEYNKKKNKDKISDFKQEIPKMNIKLEEIKFGNNNTSFKANKKNNSIMQPLSSIKYMNTSISYELYEISKRKKYKTFIDLLIDLKDFTSLKKNQLEILIKLDYFKEFGKSQYLLNIVEIYDNLYTSKQINKSKLKKLNLTEDLMEKYSETITEKTYKDFNSFLLMEELIDGLENKDMSLKEKISAEEEYLGYIKYKNVKVSDKFWYVVEIKTYKNKERPYLKLYNISNGKLESFKITSGFANNPFKEKDIIKVNSIKKVPKMTKNADGKWVKTEGFNMHIERWQVF